MIGEYGELILEEGRLPRRKRVRVPDVLAWLMGEDKASLNPADSERQTALRNRGITEAAAILARAIPHLISGGDEKTAIEESLASSGVRLSAMTGDLWRLEGRSGIIGYELWEQRKEKRSLIFKDLKLRREHVILHFIEKPAQRRAVWISDLCHLSSWPFDVLLTLLSTDCDFEKAFYRLEAPAWHIDRPFDRRHRREITPIDWNDFLEPLTRFLHEGSLKALRLGKDPNDLNEVKPHEWLNKQLFLDSLGDLRAADPDARETAWTIAGFGVSSIKQTYPKIDVAIADFLKDARPTSGSSNAKSSPPLPNKRRSGRPPIMRQRVANAAIELWGELRRPDGLSQQAALAAVNERLKEDRIPTTSIDTLLRALGER